jgi:hypothetical protein
MNFSFHSGFKTWSVVVLAVLAIVLFWSSREKDSARTAVREPQNSLNDQNLVLTDSDRHHQDATVTAEPMYQSSNASVESTADQTMSDTSRDYVEVEHVDRTPRPFHGPRVISSCPPNRAYSASCMTEQALLTEPIDPIWSSATEGRLRDLWRENVTEMSDEFLFVECKTTACEVNYRFPQLSKNTQERTSNDNRYFSQFLGALRTSDLAAELRVSAHWYGSYGQAMYFKRTTSQSEPQANSKTPQ